MYSYLTANQPLVPFSCRLTHPSPCRVAPVVRAPPRILSHARSAGGLGRLLQRPRVYLAVAARADRGGPRFTRQGVRVRVRVGVRVRVRVKVKDCFPLPISDGAVTVSFWRGFDRFDFLTLVLYNDDSQSTTIITSPTTTPLFSFSSFVPLRRKVMSFESREFF
jgi:hypothetical protein